MGENNIDLFGHNERDANAIAGKYHLLKDKDAYHIWPDKGTPHPVWERHKKKKRGKYAKSRKTK